MLFISYKFWIGKWFMLIANKEINLEKRIKPRRPYSGNIFFTAKNGFYEGRLKNFSHNGLFITTTACLSVGEIVTIALPHLNDKNIKCKGQIIWRNNQGCGIELFRKRSNSKLRIIKWGAKEAILSNIVKAKSYPRCVYSKKMNRLS